MLLVLSSPAGVAQDAPRVAEQRRAGEQREGADRHQQPGDGCLHVSSCSLLVVVSLVLLVFVIVLLVVLVLIIIMIVIIMIIIITIIIISITNSY